MIEAYEVLDRSVVFMLSLSIVAIRELIETPTEKRRHLSAYKGPETTVLTDLVVAIRLYSVADHDSSGMPHSC